MNNWKLRHSFTGNETSDVQTVNGYLASGEDNDFAVTVVPDGKEYAAPLFIPRTNLLLQSNQFDTSPWANSNTTNTPDQSGYDDTNDAWLAEVSGGAQIIGQNVSGSGVQTVSLYAKGSVNNGLRIFAFGDNNVDFWFDLNTGLPDGGISSKVLSYDIKDAGNGWYRCSFTFTQNTTSIYFYISDNKRSNATSGGIYIQDAQLETGSVATEYIPTTTAAVTRDWSAFGRVQNQLPGICNGTHTHTGAASGSGIAATTITGSGSGATFAYDFDTLGVLTTLTADGAGSGYKVGDKLSIDTTEGHTIEFRLVEGSNAATVSVSMDATRPNKPIPFPVSKMRVEGLTDRTVLFLDKRSQYVFPKPTPYLLDTYEGAAAAYSLRRLRSAYTGPAVRVRRASNNDELDIYFNRDGSLDTATLEAFCAGTNGFVSVWYDQGQGGNDATQGATGAQPKIYDSDDGVVEENGLPAVEFTRTSSHRLENSSDIMTGPDLCLISVFKGTSASTETRFIIDQSGANYGGTLAIGSTNKLEASARFTGAFVGFGTSIDSTAQHLLFGNWVSGDSYFAIDGTVASSSSTAFSGSGSPGVPFWIGGDSATSLRYVDGNLQEIIIYNSDQDSNRTGIESNVNDFYSIYP